VICSNLLLIDRISGQLRELEEAIELTSDQEKTGALLRTMPGIGKMIALTITAEICDLVL
jgi:transposase